ncbi:Uncharacterised protein [Bordetella pertussis]|nr:Uncharacterised protein [Bordetella pertussis]CFW05168.1 Uncharacterised protein [Bordetella pertussis]
MRSGRNSSTWNFQAASGSRAAGSMRSSSIHAPVWASTGNSMACSI